MDRIVDSIHTKHFKEGGRTLHRPDVDLLGQDRSLYTGSVSFIFLVWYQMWLYLLLATLISCIQDRRRAHRLGIMPPNACEDECNGRASDIFAWRNRMVFLGFIPANTDDISPFIPSLLGIVSLFGVGFSFVEKAEFVFYKVLSGNIFPLVFYTCSPPHRKQVSIIITTS